MGGSLANMEGYIRLAIVIGVVIAIAWIIINILFIIQGLRFFNKAIRYLDGKEYTIEETTIEETTETIEE